ncbi:hypothetical protein H2200_013607 [Cladophialophora chaetospira]|uniref:NACHT domain-containing protein n=1 Tax=Cladophialophora chaetospira TaxID=386627 RepID=A0AA38UDP1_9EURO|nr:hypothetical protein H2200_013607 [Cladophialophora chaetospira]
MAAATSGRKRDRVRQWLSSRGSTPSGSGPVSALVSTTTSQSTSLPASTTTQQDFHDRVLSLLSSEARDTIQRQSVTKAKDVDTLVQQALVATRQKQATCQAKRWTFTVRGHTIVLKDQADGVAKWLDRFKQVGDVASNVDPVHVGLPWAGIRLLLEAAISEQNQMAALLLGLETALYLSNRLRVYLGYLTILPISAARDNFEACLTEFHAMILRFLASAIRIYEKGSITRAFEAFWRNEDMSTFEDECNKMAHRADIEAKNCDRDLSARDRTALKQQYQNLQQVLKQLESLRIIGAQIDNVEAKIDLGKLPMASGAAFNSHHNEHDPRCHPETRIDLLREIHDWANDVNGKCIFWLKGKAGTGKSTISRTVAQTFAEQGRLGASFFFKRGEHDRQNASLFFTTIALDLARQIPGLATYMHHAIDQDPGIAHRTLKEQFDKLIYQPLIDIGPSSSAGPILVIDALDECDRKGDIRTILSLLASTRRRSSTPVRIFLTSRPELPIDLGFAHIGTESHRDVALHDIPPSTLRHDISIYLESEFRGIREEHNYLWPFDQSLDADWPGQQTMEALVELSMPLFIVAATISRFVGEHHGDPRDRLATFLDHLKTGQMYQMENTYLPTLSQILIDVEEPQERDKLCRDFRDIIGSIVLVANPLSAEALSQLLQVPRRRIDHQLRLLHPVLSVPACPDSPITLFHLSFREFLVKKSHSDRARLFAVDESFTHACLSDQCLALLQSPGGLRKDICELQDPGIRREDIDATVIDKHISPALRYACRYWIYHLQQSGRIVCDNDIVAKFLQQHFLHWLESLSLVGGMLESVNLIVTLQSLVETENSHISAFLNDARRFVLAFNSILAQAPLQVYAGAWHFSPLQSNIRSAFQDQALGSIRTGECQHTLEGHSDGVRSVVFSPDGSRVASGSYDNTVRIWDIQTGECQHTLEGHSKGVYSVVFSPDGSRVASGSDDNTVRIWDIQTGECQHTLEGHSDGVYSVVFSPDGSRVASGSGDQTVRLWDVQTGEYQHTLEGHSNWVWSVVFSPDGSRVASGSGDQTVRLWDVQTGECQHTLEGHSNWVWSVVFSPDGSRVASGSFDHTVRIWDMQTGECQYTLEGHSDGVYSVVFSPDGSRVASGSYDHTVRIWDVQTGECQHTLEGHSDGVRSVVFSPDGSRVASGSGDQTVRIWDIQTGECQHTLEGHSDGVRSVVFSPDGSRVASGSFDHTVRIWDVQRGECQHTLEGHSDGTGECQHTLEGHSDGVWSVVFSPDGSRVASGSSDHTVRIWDIQTGECQHTLEGHSAGVYSMMFSPDGSRVASGSFDHTVRIWDVQTGECQHTLEGHSDWVRSVVFSPDGSRVASSSDDKTVRIWDIMKGTELLCHDSGIFPVSAEFSKDGSSISVNGQIVTTSSSPPNPTSGSPRSRPVSASGGNLSVTDSWLMWGTKRVLWLPPEYRPGELANRSNAISIGSGNGRVTLVHLTV